MSAAEARAPQPGASPGGAGDEELFDPEFLRRLRTLFFKLRRRRQLKRRGLQQTQAAGFTREFKDHRPYTSRDDYRAIDWRLFARLERLFVRIFEEVQEFHVHVLIDTSASMADPHPEKRRVALRLAVALAYLALMNQHRVSLLTFGEDVRPLVPPRKGQGHIHTILQVAAAVPFAGRTDLEGCLRRFRPGRDRRGLVFVISDLLGDDPTRAEEALAQAVRWPAETHVAHVLAPEEIAPRVDGEVRLVDTETGETRRMALTPRDLERYERAFRAHLERLATSCRQRQIGYLPWTTDQPFEAMFLELLARGSLAGGR